MIIPIGKGNQLTNSVQHISYYCVIIKSENTTTCNYYNP